MSDQNPIHRDGGRRDVAGHPANDAKETFAEKQAKIDRNAPVPGGQGDGLTEVEREELQKQAASDRLADVQKEHEESQDS